MYILTQVNELVLRKFVLAGQPCIEHSCSKFHENPTNGSVADIKSHKDGQTDVASPQGVSASLFLTNSHKLLIGSAFYPANLVCHFPPLFQRAYQRPSSRLQFTRYASRQEATKDIGHIKWRPITCDPTFAQRRTCRWHGASYCAVRTEILNTIHANFCV